MKKCWQVNAWATRTYDMSRGSHTFQVLFHNGKIAKNKLITDPIQPPNKTMSTLSVQSSEIINY